MITTAIFPSRYVQGAGALDALGDELARLGGKALVLLAPFAARELGERIDATLAAAGVEARLEVFNGECSDEEVERLVAIAGPLGVNVVAGIGGGKMLDTAKAVAFAMKARVAIVPTIASTDAPCSALSVIYTPQGEFKRYLVLPTNPDLVLVDTAIVAKAPVRLLVAGMGDALATWFEAESCRIRGAGNMTGRPGPMTAHGLARLCFDTLFEYGPLARAACEGGVVTPALEKVVEANTLLSGLGFESGGLAAAHAIHNGLTVLEQTHEYWHGEKVAFGTLATLMLTGADPALVDRVYDFCDAVGLPTTLAEIGLDGVSETELRRAAEAACAPGETIHNEPHAITADAVLAAMIAADAYGRSRQACCC
ncbi:glycerol dehydrogenase [Jeongeupia naejangsanensis]|uniref:Glycerol dehydrogenase n=1 Tax=Jeongeupia naejangsanensis TaxID=613195 RepID=A0ABS2BK74_9NEIS|nr:glycerol dehydrogenase [Jeongeupia naejangsanensis]MBM3115825.1 glycerol dehydrogenase [Jeongeupia naejangsanensis]